MLYLSVAGLENIDDQDRNPNVDDSVCTHLDKNIWSGNKLFFVCISQPSYIFTEFLSLRSDCMPVTVAEQTFFLLTLTRVAQILFPGGIKIICNCWAAWTFGAGYFGKRIFDTVSPPTKPSAKCSGWYLKWSSLWSKFKMIIILEIKMVQISCSQLPLRGRLLLHQLNVTIVGATSCTSCLQLAS